MLNYCYVKHILVEFVHDGQLISEYPVYNQELNVCHPQQMILDPSAVVNQNDTQNSNQLGKEVKHASKSFDLYTTKKCITKYKQQRETRQTNIYFDDVDGGDFAPYFG